MVAIVDQVLDDAAAWVRYVDAKKEIYERDNYAYQIDKVRGHFGDAIRQRSKAISWVLDDAAAKTPEQIDAAVIGAWMEKLRAGIAPIRYGADGKRVDEALRVVES